MKLTRKLNSTRWGIENAVGHQVAMDYKGRRLLGDVVAMERNQLTGVFILTVNHFNGEQWPIQPRALAVDVLIQTDTQ